MTLGPPPPDGDGIGARVFTSFEDLRAACLDLPPGDVSAAALALERQSELTKPPGSLGRLEDVVGWLAQWQGRSMPRLDHVDILVFAGNHGVTAQGVSAYPAAVTTQMVANFAAGGAAINQLARVGGSQAAGDSARARDTHGGLHASAGDGRSGISGRGRHRIPDGRVGRGPRLPGRDGNREYHGGSGGGRGAVRRRRRALGRSRHRRRRPGPGTKAVRDRHGACPTRSTPRRPAGERGGARRARTCRHPGRGAGGAATPDPGAARRLRLNRGGRAAGEAAPRCARSCLGGACRGRGGASDVVERARARAAPRSRHASRRGRRARPWRCRCCAPRSPATPAWPRSRRRASPTNRSSWNSRSRRQVLSRAPCAQSRGRTCR